MDIPGLDAATLNAAIERQAGVLAEKINALLQRVPGLEVQQPLKLNSNLQFTDLNLNMVEVSAADATLERTLERSLAEQAAKEFDPNFQRFTRETVFAKYSIGFVDDGNLAATCAFSLGKREALPRNFSLYEPDSAPVQWIQPSKNCSMVARKQTDMPAWQPRQANYNLNLKLSSVRIEGTVTAMATDPAEFIMQAVESISGGKKQKSKRTKQKKEKTAPSVKLIVELRAADFTLSGAGLFGELVSGLLRRFLRGVSVRFEL